VSAEIAHMTGVYHFGDHPDMVQSLQREMVSLPMENLMDYATGVHAQNLLLLLAKAEKRENAMVGLVTEKFKNILALNYEDDLGLDLNIAISKIAGHFSIPQSPITVAVKKTSRGLRNDLSNFDAIEDLLRGTPYAWMLE
jgi:predicted DNA-binding protein YlxM (UPF0122 family)